MLENNSTENKLEINTQSNLGENINDKKKYNVTIKDNFNTYEITDGNNNFSGKLVNLSRKDLSGLHLNNSSLKNVLFKNTNLKDVNFENSDLTNANLTDANLTNANLTNANLTNANLTNADLTNANLTNANFTGADLKSAVFTRAQYIDTASFIGTKNMNKAINFKTEGEHYKDWENDWGYGGAKTNKKRFRNKKTNKRRFRNKKTNKRRFRNKKLKKRYSIVNK